MNNSAEKTPNNIHSDDEIWKDIIDFEGLYKISNYGNIKSCSRYVNIKSGKRVVNEKLLSLAKDRDGYLMAILCKNATRKTVKVHRLVANAFIEKIDGKFFVNHIDSNKSNNNLNNLEWVSNLENICHSRLKMKTTSKYIGVYFYKRDNVFRATARLNSKIISLGSFKTEEEAYEARVKFEKDNGVDNKYL
jgi:ABC-type Na+ transport system ATPase subunit NatA